MLNWIGIDQSMKMRATSRVQDKKPVVNNYLGKALKFYASVRIDIRKIETLKKAGESYGNRVRAKIVKNKVAPPFTEAEFDIVFGKGIDSDGEVIDLGADLGIIVKGGAWYSLPDGTKLGQGKDKAKEYVLANPELLEKLKKEISEKLTPKEASIKEIEVDSDSEL